MCQFDSLATLRKFFRGAPGATAARDVEHARGEYRDELLDWLQNDGRFELEGLDRDAPLASEPVTAFVFVRDDERYFRLYVVPDSAISEAQRAAFDALGHALFVQELGVDLTPAQIPGALWLLVSTVPDKSYNQSYIEHIAEDCAGAGVDVEAMKAAYRSWWPYEDQDGRRLGAPVSHVYCARLTT